MGDSEPPPNSGGEPASPYLIQLGFAAGRVASPVLRKELLAGPPAQLYLAAPGPLGKVYSLYVSEAVLVPVQYGHP